MAASLVSFFLRSMIICLNKMGKECFIQLDNIPSIFLFSLLFSFSSILHHKILFTDHFIKRLILNHQYRKDRIISCCVQLIKLSVLVCWSTARLYWQKRTITWSCIHGQYTVYVYHSLVFSCPFYYKTMVRTLIVYLSGVWWHEELFLVHII
jgi:hypothetical protein